MRTLNHGLLLFLVAGLASHVAWADDAPPAGGAPAPADPAAPPPADKPAEPATPPTEPAKPAEPEKPKGTNSAVPTGAIDTKPTAGSMISSTVDDGGVSASSGGPAKSKPRIALELSGAGAYIANQYVEYKGWTLENGMPKGFRFEADLIGILVGYELSSMGNDQACGTSCVTGSFGSTTMHALEVGYRYRFSQLGPVRPFLTMSLGGVIADTGNWSPMAKTVKGGQGRAGFGVEVPIMDKFFASASIAYRIVITENPMRDPGLEGSQSVLVPAGDKPNGDYAEDLHLVSAYIGFGVSL